MGKDKLRKFAEIGTFDNVVELDAGKALKGQWAKTHFKNDNPIVVELACGKGEYTVNLAKLSLKRILLVLTIRVTGFGEEQKLLLKKVLVMLDFYVFRLKLFWNILQRMKFPKSGLHSQTHNRRIAVRKKD